VLTFLDIFLGVFHVLLILACLLGWIFPRTRRAHLILMGVVVGCWFLLGLKYGIGYCPLTDWNWQVKEQLGESALPHSFIKYLWDKIFPTPITPKAVDGLTFAAFFISLAAALYHHFKRKANPKEDTPPM
jgi:hypothetical protein